MLRAERHALQRYYRHVQLVHLTSTSQRCQELSCSEKAFLLTSFQILCLGLTNCKDEDDRQTARARLVNHDESKLTPSLSFAQLSLSLSPLLFFSFFLPPTGISLLLFFTPPLPPPRSLFNIYTPFLLPFFTSAFFPLLLQAPPPPPLVFLCFKHCVYAWR